MAGYDTTRVPRGTSRRWEVLMSDDEALPSRARGPRRSALEVRADHRVLRHFGEAELRAMPLLAQGAPLARRGRYLDLHDPARADFVAEGDEVVEPGQHVVARTDVSEDLWDELRRACDGVLARRGPPRLRRAV